jgi:hypothetical protein
MCISNVQFNFLTIHRLHLLGPNPKVLLACKVILIAEFVLVATPTAILSYGASALKLQFPYAYSVAARIEPVIYAFVCLVLSCVYIYYAYIMFSRHKDKKIKILLFRLLYSNIFLIAMDSGNIIAEYVGGGVIQTAYLAFFFALVYYFC